MRDHSVLFVLASLLLATACDRLPTAPRSTERFELQAAKGGGGNGAGGNPARMLGDVLIGDAVFDAGDATPIESDCSGHSTIDGWVDFAHTLCLIVQPDWNSATDTLYSPYALTDDVFLATHKEKGKTGAIHEVRLIGQDVIGDEGIAHETDWIPIPPVVPSPDGFTLHVHASDVAVWRKDSHTGGNRVAIIGWISIGDIVIRPQ